METLHLACVEKRSALVDIWMFSKVEPLKIQDVLKTIFW